ncbi:glycoside hydrolase family 104 protein [Massilia sp. IC2-476]|uniref:glycoside hydrolase family 24 protein n=1 Tax=Massilia sp. IC2-476 TaxID=2887199 RepID=UPI001D0FCBDD|nr:glycoside hydrolase family 104 protein [Massilia sp. IC2-476]MCC2974662.1 glycoside hydrolase family 104 protein [Massilia sp. IC2-476]
MSDAKRTASPEPSVRPSSRSAALLEENARHLAHPNVAAFLKAIAEAEGGGYDFKYGALKGRSNDRWRFRDTSTHPGPGIDGKTTAAGMYQITRPTWEHHGGKLGLKDFSPRTQDLIAVEILRSLGVIDAIKDGRLGEVMPKVARIWAALPKGPGQSNHYPPQRYVKFEDFLTAYLAGGGQTA